MNRRERRAVAKIQRTGGAGVDEALALLTDARKSGTLGEGDAPVTACPWCAHPITDPKLRFSKHELTCAFVAFARKQGAIR